MKRELKQSGVTPMDWIEFEVRTVDLKFELRIRAFVRPSVAQMLPKCCLRLQDSVFIFFFYKNKDSDKIWQDSGKIQFKTQFDMQ